MADTAAFGVLPGVGNFDAVLSLGQAVAAFVPGVGGGGHAFYLLGFLLALIRNSLVSSVDRATCVIFSYMRL